MKRIAVVGSLRAFLVALPVVCVASFTFAGESAVSLSGLWKSGRATIEIVQNGDQIKAVYVEVAPEAATRYGFKPGDTMVEGTLQGTTLRGRFNSHYPVEFKKQCPAVWQQWRPFELALSKDGTALEGRWRPSWLTASNCTQVDLEWRALKLTRAPTPAPSLAFVRRDQNRYVRITDALPYREPFYVEARFETPQPAAEYNASVSWAKGKAVEIKLRRTTEDPKLYRSAVLVLEEPSTEERR